MCVCVYVCVCVNFVSKYYSSYSLYPNELKLGRDVPWVVPHKTCIQFFDRPRTTAMGPLFLEIFQALVLLQFPWEWVQTWLECSLGGSFIKLAYIILINGWPPKWDHFLISGNLWNPKALTVSIGMSSNGWNVPWGVSFIKLAYRILMNGWPPKWDHFRITPTV